MLEAVTRAAPTNATVLLLGESGVGKELVARTIHRNSPRASQRFVQVNCAAIPEELIESELFGHEKGSFTGATEKQVGKFEQADRGTIFLDEVGDMSQKTQAKVLRVLQEQEVERLGSARTIKVDVRVIAATNKNLEEAISRGEFREDLFFRLNVIPIVVPPLRERREDIPRLVQHFAKRTAEEHNLKPKRFDQSAMEALQRYRWRGNIRELRNTVERLLIMTPTEFVRGDDLPAEIRSGEPPRAVPESERGEEQRDACNRARHIARIQGRRRARVSRAEAAREQLEYLAHRRTHRHATQQPVQEARAVRDQAGSGRAERRPLSDGRGYAIIDQSQSARRSPAFAPGLRRACSFPDGAGLSAQVRRTKAGGKSELRRAVRRVTPGQGNLTEQWHRKYTAPACPADSRGVARSTAAALTPLPRKCAGHAEVRVKWCGKSAPRRR